MADKLVELLNSLGYQPVFARVGLRPPKIYTYEKSKRGFVMQMRGDFATYLPNPKKEMPAVKTQQLANEIASTYTSGKNLDGSIQFLRRALECIGIVGAPKLDLGFAGSKELRFALTDLEAISVTAAELELPLQDLELDRLPPELLAQGKAYVAYEYLAASTVVMERGDSKAFDANVEAKLGDYVDAGVDADVKVKDNSKLLFQGKHGKRAVFAMKLGRIDVRQDKRYLTLNDGFAGDASANKAWVIPRPNAVLLAVDEEAAE